MANFCKYCGTALEEAGLCRCDTARAERAVLEARRRVAAATQQASAPPQGQARPVAGAAVPNNGSAKPTHLPVNPQNPQTPAPCAKTMQAPAALDSVAPVAPVTAVAPVAAVASVAAVTSVAAASLAHTQPVQASTAAPVPSAISGFPDALVTPAAAKAAVAATLQGRGQPPLPTSAASVPPAAPPAAQAAGATAPTRPASFPHAGQAVSLSVPAPMQGKSATPAVQQATEQPAPPHGDAHRPTGTTAILRPQEARPSPAALAQGVETVHVLQVVSPEAPKQVTPPTQAAFLAPAQEAASFAPIQAVQFSIPTASTPPIAAQVFDALAQQPNVALEASDSSGQLLGDLDDDITIHTNAARAPFGEKLGAVCSDAVHSVLALWQAPDTAAGALGKELPWPSAAVLMGLQALATALFALVVVLRLPGNASGAVCALAAFSSFIGSGFLCVALATLLWGGARLMGGAPHFTQGLRLAGVRSAAVLPVTLAAVVAAMVYPLAGIVVFSLGILATAAVLSKAVDALETGHNGLRTHLAAGACALLVLLQLALLRGAFALFAQTLLQQFTGIFV